MKLKDSEIVFAALADQTRFRILNLLIEGELCVCDLMKVLKLPQSKISRHLSYLRRAKLAEARKEGLWMYYRLAQPSSKIFKSVLNALTCCRLDFKELEEDLSEFKKSRKNLVSCCR